MTRAFTEEDRLTEMSDAWTDDQPAYRSWMQAIEEIQLDNRTVTLAHAVQGKCDDAGTLNY
ncbi:hypothetical protein [Deinococcus enclensis]|uniref:Uncharacterized protein n=1 Tax=Deinococcus enclensis TaxID=1049582 RepID=A0ABT9MI86_9DEIO|nr:hypothetical protein [Deinococcus enclensis]MDP9766166.1 hypothetical protein [Deinococcus enclensis]